MMVYDPNDDDQGSPPSKVMGVILVLMLLGGVGLIAAAMWGIGVFG